MEEIAQGIELEAGGGVAFGAVAFRSGAGIAVAYGGIGGRKDLNAGEVALVLNILVQVRQNPFHFVGMVGKNFDFVGDGKIPQTHLENDRGGAAQNVSGGDRRLPQGCVDISPGHVVAQGDLGSKGHRLLGFANGGAVVNDVAAQKGGVGNGNNHILKGAQSGD